MKQSIYASNRYKRFFAKSIGDIKFTRTLRIQAIDNATVIIEPTTQRFGVFDDNGSLIQASLQLRNKIVQEPPKFTPPTNFLDIEAVYIGTLEDHFGHFLLEHTNRLYPLLQAKYKNMKYIILNNRNLPTVPDFVFDFLQMLGIKQSDVYVINDNIKVKRLYVPPVAFEIPNMSSSAFGKTFDAAAAHAQPAHQIEKIYVSRERLPERATFGEQQIQRVFEKNGFTVIYPEQLSLYEQICYMKHCKCLAGIAGSALHLSLFMPCGGTVIQIKRNKLPADNANTQYLLCKTKNCDFVLVDCAREILPTHHWSEFPQIIGPTKYLEQFLRDFQFTYDAQHFVCDKSVRRAYRSAFRAKGGFWRYQTKRTLFYILPRLMLTYNSKTYIRRWLNKHL